MGVMKHVFLSFSMILVGTYACPKKKSRTVDDFSFAKLSNEALKKVKHRWKQMVGRKIVNQNTKTTMYTVQATVWKDQKLVEFLHNHNLVQDTKDHTVE
jgi:hypothetical protein